jgi:hypothetical protein
LVQIHLLAAVLALQEQVVAVVAALAVVQD